MGEPLLMSTERGLYCPLGGFYIDPWKCEPAMRAVITHAHSDHARAGCGSYLTPPSGAVILKARLGGGISVQTQPFGLASEQRIGDVMVSLHPAGHVLGSAMVRIRRADGVTATGDDGGTWLVTGDYKLEPDGVSEPADFVRCDTLITESTFGLPIYRWRSNNDVMAEINGWWRGCQGEGRTAVIYAYSLGKAQRLLRGVDCSIGPLFAHGAPLRLVEAYRAAGADLPSVAHAVAREVKAAAKQGAAGLVIAPGSTDGTPWQRALGPIANAVASGWMQVRGMRRRRSIDRGFVLSDHADWPGLLRMVHESGARRVGVTHGFTGPLSRYLGERGIESFVVATRFVGEGEAETDDSPATPDTAGPSGNHVAGS